MSSETASPPPSISPPAKVIGNAFVEQYYHILHHSPELVYRFYQDSSVIGRPGTDGVMTSVTTMQGINEKILSFDYKECKAEIKTADTQKSYKDGFTVLVTGCLTGKDNLKRKFAQSFFLAPQDIGYFVLNDVFRYVDDGELLENHPVKDAENVTITVDPELVRARVPLVLDQVNGNRKSDQTNVEVATYEEPSSEAHLGNEESSITIESASHSHNNVVLMEVETLDDGPKTYASIVKVAMGNMMATKVNAPATNDVKVAPKKTETRSVPVTETVAPSNTSTPESCNDNEEVEGFSIYIRNLPFAVMDDQLETEFKKFGPIKQGGVQVRNNRQHGYCFGFVEFESASSMDNAIKASPITIGDRQAVIETKRTTSRAGNGGRGGGRASMDQGAPRGNGFFRGRGGRSFGRVNEYVDRRGSEFPARGGGRGFSGREGRVGRPSYHAVADSA